MSAKSAARRTLRGVAFTLLTILLLAGVAHGLAWWWATGALAVGFSDWVTLRRAQGWAVEHGLPRRAGWPFAARLEVPGVAIAGRPAVMPEGLAWQAPLLVLSIMPTRPDTLVLDAEGPQALQLGAARFAYTAARLRALVPLDPGMPPRGTTLLVEGLQAATPDGPVVARRAEALATPRADGGVVVALSAEAVALPPLPATAAFGRMVDHIAAEAALTGPLPPPAPPARQAAAWRDAGGALDLRGIALRWGPLAAEGRGVLRLDAALQPAGSGTLAVEHPQEALRALVGAGLVPRRSETAAQAVLALMTRTSGNGAPRVEVPVAIESGTVALARIPLLRVAPVEWPGVPSPR